MCECVCVSLQIKNEPKKWKAPSAGELGLSEEADCCASHARVFSTLIGPILMRNDDSVLTAVLLEGAPDLHVSGGMATGKHTSSLTFIRSRLTLKP